MKFLIKKFSSPLDIFSIFSIFKNSPEIAFLDSAKQDSQYSDFSIIGINPYLTFKTLKNKTSINGTIHHSNDPFSLLEKELKKYSLPKSHLPFTGGAIGYFSYDAASYVEEINYTSKEDITIPEIYFNFYDNFIIYDIKNKKYYITALGVLNSPEESIKSTLEKIEKGDSISFFPPVEKEVTFFSNFTKQEYLDGVQKVIDYIKTGDVYIANLTQRFSCSCNKSPYDIYHHLRTINPAPFASYLGYSDFQIISSSPERFIKIRDGIAETRPIKGTRPRGLTPEEDDKNKEELINSEKDKSELLMIVDLERNDFSKVCKPFTVKVNELFKLEEYSTVFHLVSTIVGEIKDELSSVKFIRECFPGGSITGAPKIRAMEIIDEIENLKRNIYTGAIGYFDFNGNADFNIVIRTILTKDNQAYFGVGGGITFESEVHAEYQETLDKAKALMKVLR